MQTQLFIDGRFVPALSGETLATLNPHDNSVIAQVSMAGRADIDRAVDAAQGRVPEVEQHGGGGSRPLAAQARRCDRSERR